MTETGRAAVFRGPGKGFELRELPLPALEPGAILIRVSLANVCRWLGAHAEGLGVEIYPGFAGAEVVYDEKGSVKGVATGDMGVGRDGKHTDQYQPGIELHGKYTFFAEGCRGNLGRQRGSRASTRLHEPLLSGG